MTFDGPIFSVGIPANDNPVRVHHVDWSGRPARASLQLDTSEFVFNEGTTWSPKLLEHFATRDERRLDDTSRFGDHGEPIHWPRHAEAATNSTSSAIAAFRQFGSHAARGLTFVGVGIGLDHILFSSLSDALAERRDADSLAESSPHKPTGTGVEQPHSTIDSHVTEHAQAHPMPHGLQPVVGEAQAQAVSASGNKEAGREDPVALALNHQSYPAVAGSASVTEGLLEAAVRPAHLAGSVPVANPPGVRLLGTTGDDVLVGGEGDDFLVGAEGADTLVGLDGDDVLVGGKGADLLLGGAGDDLLDGGEDADLMFGGAGDDTYVVDVAEDVVVEFADEGNDTVKTTLEDFRLAENVENLYFAGVGSFTGYGNAGNNHIVSGDGDDRLYGDDDTPAYLPSAEIVSATTGLIEAALEEILGAQAPAFVFDMPATASLLQTSTVPQGTSANDVLNGQSNKNDVIFGGKGNDSISGGSGLGQDTLDGGSGNDLLDGGSGNDLLSGGIGNDTFVFRNGFGRDVITDFSDEGGNHDAIVLSLSAIDGYEDLDGRIQQVGDDVLITITAVDTITLQNFQLINLSVHDHFDFA